MVAFQNHRKTSKFKLGILWLSVLAIVALVIEASLMAYRNTPKQFVQNSLAIKLPESATHIMSVHGWMPGSKIVKMWAVMDIPLNDAQKLVSALNLSLAPAGNSIVFRNPGPPIPHWWDPVSRNDFAATSVKWLKESPDLRPGFLAMAWFDGKLYIYQLGRFGYVADQ